MKPELLLKMFFIVYNWEIEVTFSQIMAKTLPFEDFLKTFDHSFIIYFPKDIPEKIFDRKSALENFQPVSVVFGHYK